MRPLEGLRVVDLTRVLSGPYCTMQLGDMGAEVIKVEQPGKGDDTRAFAPPYQGDQAAYFLSINRNKKSITLDMKSEAGKAVLWRLIDKSDILVENFRPGAMERLGFGYEAVRKRRPAMVYASISGFGPAGPQKDRPGYDVIVQGEAGIMDITGPRDGAPYKVGTADRRPGLRPLCRAGHPGGALRGQVHRPGPARRHLHVRGDGVAAHLQRRHLLRHRRAARRRGNDHPTIVPYETFEAADGWINLGVANDDLWQPLLQGRRDARPGGRPALRQGRRPRAQPRGAGARRPRPRQAAHPRRLDGPPREAGGVPAGAIRTVGEVCDSDLLQARGMIAEMEHASAGVVKAVKNAVHLSGTPLDAYVAPPQLGEHTREVLTGLLGYSAAEVERLARDGVI